MDWGNWSSLFQDFAKQSQGPTMIEQKPQNLSKDY
jgi:hypothetical protein